MKKPFLIFSSFAIILASLFFACTKKKESTGITPTYKEEATGTGANPNVGNQTVTGVITQTNPATQNSSLLVGGNGWSNPTCVSSSSLILKGINGDVEVTLNFSAPPTSGNYSIATIPNSTSCSMIVVNAPNQPAGVVWYGKTGTVVINTTPTAINATFNGILCTQQNYNFPTVGVSGNIGCN